MIDPFEEKREDKYDATGKKIEEDNDEDEDDEDEEGSEDEDGNDVDFDDE
jgi:hypothetical protein